MEVKVSELKSGNEVLPINENMRINDEAVVKDMYIPIFNNVGMGTNNHELKIALKSDLGV